MYMLNHHTRTASAQLLLPDLHITDQAHMASVEHLGRQKPDDSSRGEPDQSDRVFTSMVKQFHSNLGFGLLDELLESYDSICAA